MVIRLSMMVRQGKPLPLISNDPNVKVVERKDVSIPMLQWADQILCGKNTTRRSINAEMRRVGVIKGIYPNKGGKGHLP